MSRPSQTLIGKLREEKSKREGIKITQEYFAEILDVSLETVKKWEKDPKRIPSGRLPEIADYLDCSIDYLLEHDNWKTPIDKAVMQKSGLSKSAVDALLRPSKIRPSAFLVLDVMIANQYYRLLDDAIGSYFYDYPDMDPRTRKVRRNADVNVILLHFFNTVVKDKRIAAFNNEWSARNRIEKEIAELPKTEQERYTQETINKMAVEWASQISPNKTLDDIAKKNFPDPFDFNSIP